MAQKINYRFHNPNTPEKAAEHILKILIEANMSKAMAAIERALANKDDLCYNTDTTDRK